MWWMLGCLPCLVAPRPNFFASPLPSQPPGSIVVPPCSKEAAQRGKAGLLRELLDSWAAGGQWSLVHHSASVAAGSCGEGGTVVAAAAGGSELSSREIFSPAGQIVLQPPQTSPDRTLGGEAAGGEVPKPRTKDLLHGALGVSCASWPPV